MTKTANLHTALATLILIFVIVCAMPIFHYSTVGNYSFELNRNLDSIHFLDTGASDCIIISSRGEYALIDCGYGADRVPDGEETCIDTLVPYIKELAGGEQIKFKFALATHSHNDHASGFLDILDDKSIEIEKLYIKDPVTGGVKKLHNRLCKKLEENGIPIEKDLEGLTLSVGNFSIEVLNGEYQDAQGGDDNENSLALLVRHGFTKTLLAGDVVNDSGDEDRLAEKTGNIDLLKVAHHAHYGSTTKNFTEIADPEISVVTNRKFTSKTVKARLEKYCGKRVFLTSAKGGIVAAYGLYIKIYDGACDIIDKEN